MRALLLFTILATGLNAAGVKALFDPSKPDVGPFPTDFLTAPSTTSRTAKRVRMPLPPDCVAQPNACQEAFLASDFDGFHVQARIRVRFSGAISPDTIKDGVFLVARDLLAEGEKGIHTSGDIIRLNQIVYDPATNTAYGKPDTAMDQRRRYLIAVTDAVKDTAGDPVEPDQPYTACLTAGDEYCSALAASIAGVDGKLVAASLYTTMSVTGWLEAARERLNEVSTAVTPVGSADLAGLSTITLRQQNRLSPPGFTEISVPALLLQGIRGMTVGTFTSLNFRNPQGAIEDNPVPEQIPFNVYLPRNEKPAKGYPVVIYGHGLGDSRFGGPTIVSPTLANDGFATVAINAPGHGYGPESQIVLLGVSGSRSLPAPGRGIDRNLDGSLDAAEGCSAVASSPLGFRDCMRQTVVDLMQLVRVLRSGYDVDGDGTPDFDPDRIYYVGQSLGAVYGTMFLAVEPNVRVAALNSGGGSIVDISRWSTSFRPATAQNLGLRQPSLLNNAPDFDESYVLRDQPVKVVDLPGAIEIQNALESLEWLQSEGDPLTYAVHLKSSPLAGVPEKRILWQYAQGDRTIPNPTQTALVRHAGMKSSTWIYRLDNARLISPGLDRNPHTYLTDFGFASLIITRAVQSQISSFFQEDGQFIRNPNAGLEFYPVPVFEQPEQLPESLNYLEQ